MNTIGETMENRFHSASFAREKRIKSLHAAALTMSQRNECVILIWRLIYYVWGDAGERVGARACVLGPP